MAPDDRELYAQYKKHYDAAHRARKKITRNEADLLRFKGERQILDDAIKDLTHTIKCEYGTIKRNTDKALALKAALDAKTTQAPESEPADASDLEDQ